MKQTIRYVVIVLLSISIGVMGTLVTMHYFPVETNTEKVLKEVSIQETDTIQSSIDKVYDAVVIIETYNQMGSTVGTGTGFVYKKDDTNGYILTNHHVIEGAATIKVTNTSEQSYEAKLLGGDSYSDIAVLSVEKDAVIDVAEIGDSTDVNLGDTLFTVGSPLGSKYMGTVTKGILSGKNRKVTVQTSSGNFIMEVLQTDAAINPGNSGGPLLNINGEVIGITSMKLVQDEIEGMGFAIPIEFAMASVDRLEKGEAIERPLFGIQSVDVSNTYLLRGYHISIDSSIESGIVVMKVEDDTPASRAGFQVGDVILKINDDEVTDSAHFKYALYQYSVGDTITVTYNRDGKTKTVEVKLDKSLS